MSLLWKADDDDAIETEQKQMMTFHFGINKWATRGKVPNDELKRF